MPKAWRSEYYVLTAHAEHGPYPTRELAEKIRARLAANGSEAQIHGSAQLVEYPAPMGTATLELKADDSQLQAALNHAERRVAASVERMQDLLDSLHVDDDVDSLQKVLDASEERLERILRTSALQQDALAALDRRLQALERFYTRKTVTNIVREQLRNAARTAANAPRE